MGTRRLIATAIAVACLALGACGSAGEGPDVSVPTSVPDRSTTVPPEAGATVPPAAETPTTETPTTETPAAGTPTTETPTTGSPTTETPTTETPTTETPTTETPTTETPTTETPTTETPTTEAQPAGSEEAADDSTPLWPWLLAGLVVIGLIAFLVMRRSRRAAAWQQQTVAAFDEATRLATHLAAVAPEGAAMVAAQDAGQLADLAAMLSALGAETSDEGQRRAIGSVRDQVQVLHGVVDGIVVGSGPASPAALDYLKEQATALHGAAARARAEVLPGTPGAGGPASA